MSDTMHCEKISVDCIPSNFKSEYLVFDFYVRKDKGFEMSKFIMAMLDKYGIPFIGLYSYRWHSLKKEDINTREDIENTIREYAESLQEHHSRKLKM